MDSLEFRGVWYMARQPAAGIKYMTHRKSGTLVIDADSMRFEGKGPGVVMSHIHAVSITRPDAPRWLLASWLLSRLILWVRVDYSVGTESTSAFFSDGRLLGWRGIFGGTRRLLSAIQAVGRSEGPEIKPVPSLASDPGPSSPSDVPPIPAPPA
jgi:hypothetical protein